MNKNSKNYTKGRFRLLTTCTKVQPKSGARLFVARAKAGPSLKRTLLIRKRKTYFLVLTQKSEFTFQTNSLDNNPSSTSKTAPKPFMKILAPRKATRRLEESAQKTDIPSSTKKAIYKKKVFPKKLTSSSQITSKGILKAACAFAKPKAACAEAKPKARTVGKSAPRKSAPRKSAPPFAQNLYKSFMGKVTLAPQISTQIRDQKSPDIQKENKKVKEAYKQEQRGKNLQKYIQEIKGASKKLLPRHKVLKTRSPRLEFFLKSKIRNTAVSPKDSRFKDLYAKLTKRVKTWYKNSLPESKSLLSTPVLPGLLPNGSLQDSPDLHQLIHGKDLVGPTFVGVLERNKILNPFLYGHTGGLEILDIDFLIPQMKRVRSLLLLTFLRKGNILIISNDPLHSQILQEVSKRSKRFLVVSKWTHGLLTNWKQVQPHFFQKHSKKKLFKDTKEYLKLCNRNRTKIHQKGRLRLGEAKGRLRLGEANRTSTEFTRFGRDLRVHRDTKVYAKDGGSSSAVSAKSKPKLSTSLLAFERLRSKPESKPVKPSSSKLVKGVKTQSFGRQPVSRKLSKRRLNKNRNLKKNKNLKKKKILYLKVLKWKKTRNLKSHGVAPPRFTKVSPKKALRGKDFLRKKRFFLVSPPKKKKKLALPTFVLVIDPDEHQDAILEARKIKIPIISFLPLGAKAHSVDYLLPVPGELTDYLYWFCQQLVNWKYQAKQMALDLEEIYQKKKLQRKKKMRRTLQIRKKTRNKKKRSLRILKTLA